MLCDGYYADLNFSNTLGYHEGYYYKYALDVKSEEDIYNEILEGEIYGSKDYNYTAISGLSPNSDYVYCCIPYSGESKSRKYGKMLVQSFTTKSNSSYCDAAITNLTYNSSRWCYTISKQQRCHHYYKLLSTNDYADYWHAQEPIILALNIRDHINDKVKFPDYDYFLNDGTSYQPRNNEEDYAFFIWTWGVDDNNEFSGNIRGIEDEGYINLTASTRQQTALNATSKNNKSLKPMKKTSRAELYKMRNTLLVIRKE